MKVKDYIANFLKSVEGLDPEMEMYTECGRDFDIRKLKDDEFPKLHCHYVGYVSRLDVEMPNWSGKDSEVNKHSVFIFGNSVKLS
jgi:hypothetical protein